MALEHFALTVIQVFIYQVIASYAQYVQYAGTPYPIPYVTGYSVQGYAPVPPPVSSQPAPNSQPASLPYKAPTKTVPASASYVHRGSITPTVPIPEQPITPPVYQTAAYQISPIQQPIKATSITPSVPEPLNVQPNIQTQSSKEILYDSNTSLSKDLTSGSSPPFDSNILNNLAIALQLLIVSNLIHNPPPEPIAAPQVVDDDDILPIIAPLPIPYIPPNIPELPSYPNPHILNANFIGTSSFADNGISKSMMNAYGSPTLPATRTMGLLSPYDAIASNTPYFEAFHSNPELKSPYHLPTDYKDLFALTELFKI